MIYANSVDHNHEMDKKRKDEKKGGRQIAEIAVSGKNNQGIDPERVIENEARC